MRSAPRSAVEICPMSVIIALAALGLLMLAAYRGYSVILFAPLAALGAVLLTDPSAVAPTFTGVFMEKMVGFIKLYFPVFLLGAVFGKLIELAGFSRSIVAAAIRLLGTRQAMLVIVLVCALLTYGGVSLFVVVFAVYPFAAEMFRQSDIPKRLIPATIALGAFSFTMDALPGTPQIQNIIPSTFFGTHAWAAPWLGTLGALFVFAVGMLYLRRQANKARRNGEGYGSDLRNEPETADDLRLPNPWLALSPLVLVGVANLLFTHWIPQWYGQVHTLQLAGMATPLQTEVGKLTAIWAVQAALLLGILLARTVAGLLASLGGWRTVYWVASVLMVIMALALWRGLPRVKQENHLNYPQLLASVFSLFTRDKLLRTRAILGCLTFANFSILWTSMAFLLAAPPFNYSEGVIGLFGLAGAAGALGARPAGGLADKGKSHMTTSAGLVLLLLSWAAIWYGHVSVLALIVGILVLDLTVQGVHITNQTVIYRVKPDARNRLTAGYMTSYFIGGAAGSLISASAWQHAGWTGVCAIGAIVAAINLLVWWRGYHRQEAIH